jgi:hypothetical protein
MAAFSGPFAYAVDSSKGRIWMQRKVRTPSNKNSSTTGVDGDDYDRFAIYGDDWQWNRGW